MIDFRLRPTLVSILAIPALAAACATNKSNQTGPNGEPVAAEAPASSDSQATNENLPPELKNAESFDPATTLDEKTVQESDFYQIKQSVEKNKNTLDESWKEQERMESSIKAANQAEEARKAAQAKQEEEERERQRQESIKEFEKTKDKRAKDEQDATDEAKKLPTINEDEVNWKGLEH